jgi:amino acid transporter
VTSLTAEKLSRRKRTADGGRREQPVVLSPAAAYPPLRDDQVGLLRQIGEKWDQALGDSRRRELPVDPSLRVSPARSARGAGRGRFVSVRLDGTHASDLAVTERVGEEAEPLLARLRRVILGPPLQSAAVTHERLRKLVALPVLASDALSSVAYGPEAMLGVLVLGGHRALGLSLPISAAIALLMVAVGLSYRQTIRAYPSGGGSYIVASANLGAIPGLAAAAGLMLDYVLTVAISVAAGVTAVTSAIPALAGDQILLGLGAIAVLVAGNLRGVREGGALFAGPTYLFIAAMYLLIAVGLINAAERGFSALPPPPVHATEAVGLLLVLRAFSSGATAMTGIEAISNGIPAFKPVEWRNARTTLTSMLTLLLTMFAGIALLAWLDGVIPSTSQTMLSQLAHLELGHGILYGYVQAATALVLLLAANTAFSDYPRLLFFLARDNAAPRIFMQMGDRLAFSNGIIFLGAFAAAIYVALDGSVERLIPLYAVGVFLAFTLSQTGMVIHWWRGREPGWPSSILFNLFGAIASAIVLVVTASVKFTGGAWIVVLLVPAIVWLSLRIRHHYESVRRAVALHPLRTPAHRSLVVPTIREVAAPSQRADSGIAEREEAPDEVRLLAVVYVEAINLASLRALAYAASLGQPVLAVHFAPDEDERRRFRRYWQAWGDQLPLEVVVSPYRALVAPLTAYVRALHEQRPDLTITIVLSEIVVTSGWHQLLHSNIAARLRRALRPLPGVVITSVPFHLARA